MRTKARGRRAAQRGAAGFLSTEAGNMALMSVLAAPAALGLTGLAVDYGRAVQARAALQHAADAAALTLAAAQVVNDPRPDSDARPIVEAGLGATTSATLGDVEVEQIYEQGFARVEANATIVNFFSAFAGYAATEVRVVAEAKFDDPPATDILVLLDNSPSMLIGATKKDMKGIEKINKDMGEGNCAFACHYAGRDSYTEAHEAGWATRLDAAKDAINDALDAATASTELHGAEVYFALRTFTAEYVEVAEGVSSVLREDGAVDAIEPIDKPSSRIYEQSDMKMALATASAELAERRAAHPDRTPFVLFVTDGVTDYSNGGRKITPVDPAWCAGIKSQGVKLGVIYTTYHQIPSNGFWKSNVKPFDAQIAPKLAACGSPGWFFEAEHADDIANAFNRLMELTLPKPRLTR